MPRNAAIAPTASGSLQALAHSAFLSAKGYAIRQVRAGRAFHEVLARLEESQWFSRSALEELQNAKLRAMVRHAYENVPYYRRTFDRHGVRPGDIERAEDLVRLPTVSKDTIRANPQDFVARDQTKRLIATGWTTGTTGAPLAIRRTLESIIFDKATLARQRRWAGAAIGDRNVAIWGTIWSNVIVPRNATRPPFWRFNAADNQLLMSYYHLSDATLPLYAEKLRSFTPSFIEAFPSTLLAFARFLQGSGETIPVGALLTSSEPLFGVHRREIEAAFQTRIFDYYGHAERAVTAAECPAGKLHLNPEYGIAEILNGEERVATGERGEIVATGLTNSGMPLIRYRTGDVSHLVAETCACGRMSPQLGRIDGRTADMIHMPDGRVMPGDGVMEAFYGLSNIKESQIVQEDLDHVIVKLVPDNPRAPVDLALLGRNLERCLGGDMRIEFQLLESLGGEAGAKRRWVVSRVDPTKTGA